MLTIIHLASGSTGNAILIGDGVSTIMLDAGISVSRLIEKCRIRPSSLSAVLVTHEHGDHSKAAHDLIRRGVRVGMSEGTARALDISRRSITVLRAGQAFYEDTFTVIPFDLDHDAEEPHGYFIKSDLTGDLAMYTADSATIPAKMDGINYFILECNFDVEMLENSGRHPELKARIRRDHMSIDWLEKYLKEVDTSKGKEIHLVHLSKWTADPVKFTTRLQKATGIPVYAYS